MMDEVLHAVEQAEKEADMILETEGKRAKEQEAEAAAKAESLAAEMKENFRKKAQTQTESCRKEEEDKMKAEREAIQQEIRFLKAGAEKKEKEVVDRLLAQIF